MHSSSTTVLLYYNDVKIHVNADKIQMVVGLSFLEPHWYIGWFDNISVSAFRVINKWTILKKNRQEKHLSICHSATVTMSWILMFHSLCTRGHSATALQFCYSTSWIIKHKNQKNEQWKLNQWIERENPSIFHLCDLGWRGKMKYFKAKIRDQDLCGIQVHCISKIAE